MDSLLKKSDKSLADAMSAKLWLLSQWSELSSILSISDQRKDKVLAVVERYIPFWLEQREPLTKLKLPENCAVDKGQWALYLGREIRSIPVKDPEALRSIEKWIRNWQTTFFLSRASSKFVVEVICVSDSGASKRGSGQRSYLVRKAPSAADRLFSVLSSLAKLADEIDTAYVKPDHTRLEGRPVSGGLPSLGARR